MTDTRGSPKPVRAAVIAALVTCVGTLGAAWIGLHRPVEKQLRNLEQHNKQLIEESEARRLELAKIGSQIQVMADENAALRKDLESARKNLDGLGPPHAGGVATGSAKVPDVSLASTPREYRHDAARHIYKLNSQRIFPGKLPPLLYAIGTLQVDLDKSGKVLSMRWMRAPKHAPKVIAEIERTVLAASPFPVAIKLGKVTWTDTWLWDKGGSFQLDTLTEGQL